MPEPTVPAEPPARRTLPGLLRRNSAAYGGRPAIVGDGAAVSHARLDSESRGLAARLVAAGVAKSSRVGLIMPNGVEWSVAAVAVMRIGATLVPLSTLLRPPELRAALETAAVTDLIVTPRYRGRNYLEDLDEAAPGVLAATRGGVRHRALPFLRHLWLSRELPTLAEDHAAGPAETPGLAGSSSLAAAHTVVAALEAAVRPADDLAIIFTSGSRGTPKAVIHTHGNALRAAAASLEARRLGPEDRLYIPMPFFWTGGFAMGLMSVLIAGATLLTESESDPEATIGLLERQRATLFRGWPDQAARIAAHPRFATADLSSLRPGSLPAVLGGRDRPAPGARASLLGMTETFGPYSGYRLDLDMPPAKHGSCGRPFEGVEVRIADPGSGREVPAGADGEIRLRGPNLMRAICGRGRAETFDADGFYPTGDLGALDSDGYLWLRGRLDDMFKVRGATVYPSEVESALREIDGVRQAYVTSVPVDAGTGTGTGGYAVGAVVISARDASQIAAAAAARLSSFKVPTRWLVLGSVDEVPRTPTGKVSPADLRDLLMERPGEVTRLRLDEGLHAGRGAGEVIERVVQIREADPPRAERRGADPAVGQRRDDLAELRGRVVDGEADRYLLHQRRYRGQGRGLQAQAGDHDATAGTGRRDAAVEQARPARAFRDDVVASAFGIGERGEHVGRPERTRDVPPGLDRVHRRDAARAKGTGPRDGRMAHRAGTDDQNVLARVEPGGPDGVQPHRERLYGNSLQRVDARREGKGARRGDDGQFGEPAADWAKPDQPGRGAVGHVSRLAPLAPAAGMHREHRRVHARAPLGGAGPGGDDLAAELMPHDRALRHGHPRLDVGAAQAAGGDPQQQLARTWRRVRQRDDFVLPARADDGCAHGLRPPRPALWPSLRRAPWSRRRPASSPRRTCRGS